MVPFRALIGLLFLVVLMHPVAADQHVCNDFDVTPVHLTIPENRDHRTEIFTIHNNNNQRFRIIDARIIENSPYFDASLSDVPDFVNGNANEHISLSFNTEDVNDDRTNSLSLELRGEFDDDTQCTFSQTSFTIDVTVEDGNPVCSLVDAQANNVSMVENTTLQHTIRVENHSAKDFTIQAFNVFTDSPAFNVNLNPTFSNTDFDRTIPANGVRTYTVDIDSRPVSEDVVDTAFVEIRGEYADGEACSLTEISTEFQVTVEDTGVNATVCGDIRINAPMAAITSGETSVHAFSLVNNSAQTFYVDEYTIADSNYQVSFDPLFTPDSIHFLDSEELTYNATGYANANSFDGNATLTLRGHFTSGASCFITAKKIPFSFTGSQGASCSAFYTSLPAISVLMGTPSLDVVFHNPLHETANVSFTLENGTVSPSAVTLGPEDVELVTLHFSNVSTNTALHTTTSLEGCSISPTQTQLYFSGLDNAPLQFMNAPSILTIGDAKEFALQIENQSAFAQEGTITLIAKPGNETFTRSITVTGLDTPLVFLPTTLLQGKSAVIVQIKSAGYIVTRTIQLENAQSITVIPQVSPQPNANNEYSVNVIVQNNTPQSVDGDVIVDTPKGWTIRGGNSTHLAPFEKKTIGLVVRPSVALNDDRTILVHFSSANNTSAPTPALFKANTNPVASATAFVTSGNGIWLGILVILILIGVWHVTKPQQGGEGPVSRDAQSTHPKGKLFSNAEEAWPDEAWMNPTKK